jgi:hypothetical protein
MTEDSKADETASSIFDNTIAVHVSPTEYRFVVHQNKICEKSKFFRAACSKRWIEGQEKLVRLPEVDIEVFQSIGSGFTLVPSLPAAALWTAT